MSYGSNRDKNLKQANVKNMQKADIIIEADKEIVRKIDELAEEIKKCNARLDSLAGNNRREGENYLSRQITEVYECLHEECESLKRELRYLAVQNETAFNETSRQMSETGHGAGNRYVQTRYAQPQPPQPVQAEIDYDLLAEKIVALMPAQEYLSPDYIACKVAEQIVVPEVSSEDGVTRLAHAEEAREYPQYVSEPVEVKFDEDELADRIALKVGSLKAEDFDIIVDDDGCASISKEITEKLNYDAISSVLAEKLRSALELGTGANVDYDEMARNISEKVTVAGINEEAIADKAAAALSNYLPEIDTDEIADKVASQVLSGMPAVEVNSEEICKNISDKLIEKQEDSDYDIVIDEDGLTKITDYVSSEVKKSADKRFDIVDREIASLKAMLIGGAVIREAATSAEALEESYVTEESELVTVSDVVDGEQLTIDEAAENSEGDFAELVNELDERPASAEIMPDGLAEESGEGVDFEHMMKYNRSFIARIIQSPDEYKQYYGQVKTALLSYAKVNSSLAWSAERFNKGRETIARFKIRGKTLCLYLALDPNEYEYSVYHHADVSDNKSMRGTPMMIKIKSPRGAKKAIRLIDDMLARRDGIKRNKIIERDYAAMYPYESIEELIEDGLVKDVSKGN